MATYIISYEFDTEANRNAWVAGDANRFGYESEGVFIGISFGNELTEEQFSEEAESIGNNQDQQGRTGRRECIRMVEGESVQNALSRGLTESAIAYGSYLAS